MSFIKIIDTTVSRYGLIVLLCLFVALDFYGKVYWYTFNPSQVPLYIKSGTIFLFFSALVIKRPSLKQFLPFVILTVVFVLGQLFTVPSFSANSLLIFIKFLAPLALLLVFNHFKVIGHHKQILFKGFEWVMIGNSVLIIIGFLFSIKYFESYRFDRFGYNGLFITPSIASYTYIVALFYFVFTIKKNIFKNGMFIITLFACFLIGTKVIYAALLLLLLYLFLTSSLRYKKWLSVSAVAITLAGGYYFLFKYDIFSEIVSQDGFFSAFMSLRDKLFLENTLPYVQENWNGLNYLLGGISTFQLRSQMEFIDLLFFWGIGGAALYVYFFIKLFFTFKITRDVWMFIGVLLLVTFLSGNYITYITNIVMLLVLRERIRYNQEHNTSSFSTKNNVPHGY